MLKHLMLSVFLTLLFVIPNALQAQSSDFPPLTEGGPYGVKAQVLTFEDKSRSGWKVEVGIWYPADKTKGTPIIPGNLVLKNTVVDTTGAPYPLIIYSHGLMSGFGEFVTAKVQLASHGYVVVAPSHHDTYPALQNVVDRPLDIQLVLNELAAIKEGELAGLIDTNNVGLMGYSLGAQTSLQMLGLISDPVHYTQWCKEHATAVLVDCKVMNLEAVENYRSQLGLATLPDGRWVPFGDTRIHAVLAMAPGGFPLTTEDMLAVVTTPTMIIHGSKDEMCSYEGNAVRTYTYLGTLDRYLITIVNGGHGTFDAPELPEHFATAFFGYYLKGDKTYLLYLTPEHLPERLPDSSPYTLVWGPYEDE